MCLSVPSSKYFFTFSEDAMFCYLHALLPDLESNKRRQTGNLPLFCPSTSFKNIHTEHTFIVKKLLENMESSFTIQSKNKSQAPKKR